MWVLRGVVDCWLDLQFHDLAEGISARRVAGEGDDEGL